MALLFLALHLHFVPQHRREVTLSANKLLCDTTHHTTVSGFEIWCKWLEHLRDAVMLYIITRWMSPVQSKCLYGTHRHIIKLKAQQSKRHNFKTQITQVLIWKLTKKIGALILRSLWAVHFPLSILSCLNTWTTMHRDKMDHALHSLALFNHVLTVFHHLSCNLHNFVWPCTKYFQNVHRKFQDNFNAKIWFCIIRCWTLTWQDGTVAGMHAG